jgi:hypothetical protein
MEIEGQVDNPRRGERVDVWALAARARTLAP